MRNLTDDPVFDSPVRIPEAGENVDAETNMDPNQGPIDQGFVSLTKRTDYLRRGVEEIFLQPLYKRIDWQAKGDNSTIRVTGFGAYLPTPIGPTWVDSADFDITPTGAIGAAEWAADTWYYLYVYAAGPFLLGYEAGIEPDSRKLFKAGNGTRRYIGSFLTDGAKLPIPIMKNGGEYTYRRAQQVHSAPGTGALEDLFVDVVPPLAGDTQVDLVAQIFNNHAADDGVFELYRFGDATAAHQITIAKKSYADIRRTVEAVGASKRIQWLADADFNPVKLAVLGWKE